MKTTRMIGAANLVIAGAATGRRSLRFGAAAATTDAAATQLMTKYSCQACHPLDKKLVGPTYKEIAAKYAGDSTALAKLEQKVKTGGSGVWGAIPMPPNN